MIKRSMDYQTIMSNINLDRFWHKVNKTNDCWIWTSDKDWNGYGRFNINYKSYYAHRISYLLHHKHISAGLQLHHICNNPSCVNVEHLKQITQTENLIKSDNIGSRNKIKTHCPQGHEYTFENTYVTTANRRICKTCNRNYKLTLTR